jgi:hypothetical protein
VIEDAAMLAHLDWFDGMRKARAAPFAIVLDLRRSSGLTPRQRKMITDRMNHTDAVAPCVANALVFESAVLRGVLTALFWIRRPAYPCEVFRTLDDAIGWANARAR